MSTSVSEPLERFPARATSTASERELLHALRSREEWFRAVFEGSAMGICVVDMEGRFIEANAAFLRMVGYSMEELRRMPFSDLNHPDDDPHNLPLFRHLVEGRIGQYQIEKRYRRKDGSVLPIRLTTSVVRDAEERPRFCVAMAEDATERKRAEAEREALEQRLRHLALHDPLTGLPNRALLTERLEHALGCVAPHARRGCAVLFLDLDRFKVVNDSLGHHVGDELLRAVAARLGDCVRERDTVARLGGDEFAILLAEVKREGEALEVAERIRSALAAPVSLQGYDVFAAASIGIAVTFDPESRPEDLLRDADMAMYRARVGGRGRYAVFDQSLHADAMRRLELENDLRLALKRDELRVHYQPLVCVRSGRIQGWEALARWQHPCRGLVSPAEFIPLAEDLGLIVPLGVWVLREACRQLSEWREITGIHPLDMGVNLSVRQLLEAGLVEEVASQLREHRLPPASLKLELTESMLMEGAFTDRPLDRLRQLGVQLYLDDFGTGYSSLSYLHQLPLDALKIDRSFVLGLGDPERSRRNREIVRTIVALARSLRVAVVAEGVETAEQLAELRALGCDLAQGYLFSPPLSAAGATRLLREGLTW